MPLESLGYLQLYPLCDSILSYTGTFWGRHALQEKVFVGVATLIVSTDPIDSVCRKFPFVCKGCHSKRDKRAILKDLILVRQFL